MFEFRRLYCARAKLHDSMGSWQAWVRAGGCKWSLPRYPKGQSRTCYQYLSQIQLAQIQLAQIYRVSIQEEEDGDKFLTVKVPAVQQQTGKVDCGIFAIAFAYHAASGDNPAELQFQQERMRDHLLQCFKNNSHHFLTRFWPNDESKMHSPITRFC